MSDSKQSKEFVLALLEQFQDDGVGLMFLSAAIVSGALDISKRNPDHIYQGYIRGKEWVSAANKVLQVRDELYAERLKTNALTIVGQRDENDGRRLT